MLRATSIENFLYPYSYNPYNLSTLKIIIHLINIDFESLNFFIP